MFPITLLTLIRFDLDHSNALDPFPGDPDPRHQHPALHRLLPPRPFLGKITSHADSNHNLHAPSRPIVLLRPRQQQRHLLHRSIQRLQRHIRIQRRRSRHPDFPQQLGRSSMVEHHRHQNARRHNLPTTRRQGGTREAEDENKDEQRLGEARIRSFTS